jgi:hypothetical protein
METKDNKIFEALDKTFDTVTKDLKVKVPEIKKGTVDEDFEEARGVLKRAMAYSESTIQGILAVAQNSDNPRAYEVAAQAIKNLGDQALQAMDIQEKKQKIENADENKPKQIGTQNNIVFNGSTSDLLKAIKKENEKVIEHESTDDGDN